ncbi:PD-(D/E)XK nuclease-like domain-containing protein [Actinomadura sediminis]|uniref:PD-(D/E)XK nuclease-like domain-containing protein n=1 Tax=Actinomadura sediminis TaxID=1038904 RepID=A0ABW3EQD4_9ACTN
MSARITEPGVYDIPADLYHRDPVEGGSLSSTGARRLLQMPPARWRYELEHPTPPTPAMILGTAVHTLILGAGPKPVRVDAKRWDSKAAKEARAEEEALGNLPLLADTYDQAFAMASAVLRHPVARKLFAPARGKSEQVLVWRDEETGVMCRAMVDHMPHAGTVGLHILADLKTTTNASPRKVAKTVADFGYDQQGAWYLDGYRALGLAPDPAMVFVFVEKDPPYLVSVVELDQPALIVGGELNRRALDLYARCRATDTWPGYSPEIELVSLPAWASARLEEPF